MQNQNSNVGLVLFWVGAVYIVVVAGLGGWGEPPLIARLSEALNLGLIPFFLWAFSVPLGAILVGIGVLIQTKTKPSRIIFFAVGLFLAVFFVDILVRGFLMSTDAHFPPLFGLAGAMTLLLFLALTWFWAIRRRTLTDAEKPAADLQLVGFVFFMMATWFLCAAFSTQFSEDLTRFTPRSPVNVLIYLVLGWLFLFLSQYKARTVSVKGRPISETELAVG
jgi:hypothetical protein